MKKLFMFFVLASILSSCFIFRRSPKVGCPGSGAAIGAEQILAGDRKAMKASSRSRFKGD